jgi:hypothetical protein
MDRMPFYRRRCEGRRRHHWRPSRPKWTITRDNSCAPDGAQRVARLFALAKWASGILALSTLDPIKRADFDERVDRAIAELSGERPEERRAFILDIIKACAWEDEPAAPTDEQELLPALTDEQLLQRRIDHVIRGVADVDPPLARTLDRVAVGRALEAFSGNRGGRGRAAAHSRESALRDLLTRTPVGATDLKRIKRSRRRRP